MTDMVKDCPICWYELTTEICDQCGHQEVEFSFNETDWEEF